MSDHAVSVPIGSVQVVVKRARSRHHHRNAMFNIIVFVCGDAKWIAQRSHAEFCDLLAELKLSGVRLGRGPARCRFPISLLGMVEYTYMGHHTQLEEYMDKVLKVHNTLGQGEDAVRRYLKVEACERSKSLPSVPENRRMFRREFVSDSPHACSCVQLQHLLSHRACCHLTGKSGARRVTEHLRTRAEFVEYVFLWPPPFGRGRGHALQVCLFFFARGEAAKIWDARFQPQIAALSFPLVKRQAPHTMQARRTHMRRCSFLGRTSRTHPKNVFYK